jgi:hypothetical protein
VEKQKTPIVIQMVSLPIHFYRYVISPITPASCRHYPTCSEYSLQALKQFGLIKGSALAANRIARCQPWGTSGYDPVPKIIVRIFLKSKLKENINQYE